MADIRSLHIAHVIYRLDLGGLENGLVNLINGLPAHRFRHTVVCIDDFTDFKNRLQRDDVEVIAIRKRPGTDLMALWRLYKVIRTLRPDIVHTRNLAALDALLPAFLAGVRVRIHGEHGWDVNDLDGQNRRLRLLRKMYAPLVNHYIALSNNLKQYLIEQVGIKPDRITQLYNGVDTEVFGASCTKHNDNRQISNKFDKDSILIGTVGRMQAVKDPLALARAFVLLVERSPRLAEVVRLVMIGDGPLRKNALSLIEGAGLSNIVWIPGSRNDVPEIMRLLDVYVQPSLAEGVSNTILEAMASALPVIATDVGGNIELVKDGLTGMIVPAGDPAAMSIAIEKYVSNSTVRESHGALGRKRAEDTFGMDLMLRSYAEIYSALADRSGANSPRN